MTRRAKAPSLARPVKARARALPSRTRQGGAGQGSAGASRWNAGGGAARPGPAITKPPQAGMGLHTADGVRKYLTAGERDAFLREAERAERTVRTLCMSRRPVLAA